MFESYFLSLAMLGGEDCGERMGCVRRALVNEHLAFSRE